MKNLAAAAALEDGWPIQISVRTVKNMLTLKMANFAEMENQQLNAIAAKNAMHTLNTHLNR